MHVDEHQLVDHVDCSRPSLWNFTIHHSEESQKRFIQSSFIASDQRKRQKEDHKPREAAETATIFDRTLASRSHSAACARQKKNSTDQLRMGHTIHEMKQNFQSKFKFNKHAYL